MMVGGDTAGKAERCGLKTTDEPVHSSIVNGVFRSGRSAIRIGLLSYSLLFFGFCHFFFVGGLLLLLTGMSPGRSLLRIGRALFSVQQKVGRTRSSPSFFLGTTSFAATPSSDILWGNNGHQGLGRIHSNAFGNGMGHFLFGPIQLILQGQDIATTLTAAQFFLLGNDKLKRGTVSEICIYV